MKDDKPGELSKDDLYTITVHQLKAPLGANKWAIRELLGGAEGPMSEAQKALLEEVYEKNEQALRLAENLLQADMAESDVFRFNPEETDLSELLGKVIKRVFSAAEKKGVLLKFAAESQNIPMVLADKERLSYVFENIIEDAINYSETGGSVFVTIGHEAGFITVKVQDSGIGIPEEEQSKIFDKFYRAKNAKEKVEGTGLGLFISKKIVEEHGGRIDFESKVGRGTVFRVVVPAKKGI